MEPGAVLDGRCYRRQEKAKPAGVAGADKPDDKTADAKAGDGKGGGGAGPGAARPAAQAAE